LKATFCSMRVETIFGGFSVSVVMLRWYRNNALESSPEDQVRYEFAEHEAIQHQYPVAVLDEPYLISSICSEHGCSLAFRFQPFRL
jgi:hypothetical protein